MPKRDEITVDCPASLGDHPYDPVTWEKRLAEAHARREIVLSQRASKVNPAQQTSDKTFSKKGISSRMALLHARRKGVLARRTDGGTPKGPRLVYDSQGATLGPEAGNAPISAKYVISPTTSAATGAQPTEIIRSDLPSYEPAKAQRQEVSFKSRRTLTPVEEPGPETDGAGRENTPTPRLVAFPTLPETVAEAAHKMETPAPAYPALRIFQGRRPLLLCLALFCLSCLYYAHSRGADDIVSAIGGRIAPLISYGASSGFRAPVSAMTAAPRLLSPGLSADPTQGRPLPGAFEADVVAFNAPAALQGPAGSAPKPLINPGPLLARPVVSLSPPAPPAHGQETWSDVAVFPAQTRPVYSAAPPVIASLPLGQQAWFDEWHALKDTVRIPHIAVNIPENVPTDRYQSVVARIEESAFSADVVDTTPFNIAQTHVRYYHAVDRDAAEGLANLFDAEARDFTSYSPLPDQGLLELWVSGEGAPQVPAVTRSASAQDVVTRSTRPPNTPRKPNLFERIGDAFGGLVDRDSGRATSDRGGSAYTFFGAGAGTASGASRKTSPDKGNGSNNSSTGGGQTGGSADGSGSSGSAGSNAGGGGSAGSSGSGGSAGSDAGGGSNAGGNKGGGKGGNKGGGKGGNKGGGKGGNKGGGKDGNKGGKKN